MPKRIANVVYTISVDAEKGTCGFFCHLENILMSVFSLIFGHGYVTVERTEEIADEEDK